MPMHMQRPKNNVMIVDDDPDLAILFKKILTDVGYAVCIYHTPPFMNQFKVHPPDAVLMDVWLNGEPDGLDEVRAIKKHKALSSIPIILMSSDPRVAEYAENVHANAYLAKPLDPEKLILTLNQLLTQ